MTIFSLVEVGCLEKFVYLRSWGLMLSALSEDFLDSVLK